MLKTMERHAIQRFLKAEGIGERGSMKIEVKKEEREAESKSTFGELLDILHKEEVKTRKFINEEEIPNRLSAFQKHHLYCLERFLNQNQVRAPSFTSFSLRR